MVSLVVLCAKPGDSLKLFFHLRSVISVSGDSHLAQGGKQEGATQTVSENAIFFIHLLLGKRMKVVLTFHQQLKTAFLSLQIYMSTLLFGKTQSKGKHAFLDSSQN